jgi:hypothetical protein
VIDGSIMAAIISVQTAANVSIPSPIAPGMGPMWRATITTPAQAAAAASNKRTTAR